MSQNQVSQNHTSQNLPRKETMKAVVYEGNGILRLDPLLADLHDAQPKRQDPR